MAKRKRQTSEDFDVTEFLRPTDADMRSAVSFLLRGPQVVVEAPHSVESGTPVSGIAKQGAPVSVGGSSSIPQSVPDIGIPGKSGPIITTPEAGIPVSSITPHSVAVTQIALLRRIRQAFRAQDGHSLGEQAVYQALWDHGIARDPDSRIVTIGYRTLSAVCGLTANNCKANLQGLRDKLAIEETERHTPSAGTTYLVYSPDAILKRRQTAGLTHYIKNRGVVFVDPLTGTPIGST
ncbi:MAG: hypothetical protein LC130_28365 [Bryobacterales bacterium]|nr:hypothetical protein [Bryobacterales bacterium]